jgi:hypothetical protein
VLNKTAVYSRNLSNVFLIMPKGNGDYFENGLEFVMDTQCVSCNARIENSEQICIKRMLGRIIGKRDIH